MDFLNPTNLLVAATCLVMLGCLLLIGGRVPPGLAWALIIVGAVVYFGVRLPQRERQDEGAEEDEEAEE